ncbi:MAG TPA: protein phosphatase 2C domain-containing protein, partial [Caulobacteraceae bacterium]
MGFLSVSRTHVGCRRTVNEDAVLCRPDLGLWAVADGMGGHDAGEFASALVVETLAGCDPDLDLATRTDAARRMLVEANRRLVAMGRESPTARTIGTTVVAIAADPGSFACLWAGDSRAYHCRGATLVQLTRDHSVVQALIDAGELAPAEAVDHPDSNLVTRAVGAAPELTIDTVTGEIRPGDTLLLASDGLTRLLSRDELLAGLNASDLDSAA